ncbi:glutamate racemase [Psychrobacter arcticus 273-4]|uniref:Glutamate racemase n=1 Tax=Psychrobacter arcticus (strain DSM 17307 / VKM B-2377 / 273-4) TaxID=259536 RepID=Q4FQA6_PSYA2|nr:glutamate racemase [Psychrobacter arcticus]AAZ19802.1 glutamate racemase [Psychrobacter arcticus 273-4]
MKVAASDVANPVNTYSMISDNHTSKEAMANSVIHSQEIDTKGIKADRSAPIGLFDSGIGGLSVYLHLAHQLPNERYIYYADTLHVPYGNRDSEDIKALTLTAVKWLHQQGCKLIVIACNSASAYALETARHHYPQLPIVGLVPALKPAVLASKSGHVAVLATKATLNGTLLNDVITKIASPSATRVTKYFDPQLVPWVESGMPENSKTAQNLRQQLQVFAKDGIDQLVLGCTHYPFFKDFLMQEIEEQKLSMQVVDSGQAIAERVKQLLITNKLSALPIDGLGEKSVVDVGLSGNQIKPPLTFYATKYHKDMDLLLSCLLGEQTHLLYYR